MSESEVTRAGLTGGRPGRDALFGNGQGDGSGAPDGGPDGGRSEGRAARRHRAREESPGFTSYYGRPVVKAPAWSPADIAGYLFLGGLAGAGSVLAAGAGLTGRPHTARAMKLGSVGAISLSAAALIHDLGRPERFHHMLRVAKPTSPMSVGSWLLAVYGPLSGAAALSDLTGRAPRAGRAATCGAAVLGPAVAAYTGVLLADTALPAWHAAHRHLPRLFAASAASAASGLALVAGPRAEHAPARRAAVLGTAAELAVLSGLHREAGGVAETYREGTAGRLLRAARRLSVAGAACAALSGTRAAGRLARPAATLGGLALLAGSACTRLGVFHAGLASARDPKYTLRPQRERLATRAEAPGCGAAPPG
ncbi:NrfD/PsrC family molybdoenzyme membrane anchor subunit [Streptomyces sp. DSM 44917]|uniref:NrfD/PsrC family molybdoenzyme membrane anchor subunit n=1 Tax=Streptomyces boetiae TaxID=3075541 RepID=A0ABU2LD70_9ACTN|nr:NrfD/PsrC family molybdoenzyme membrane anchor subunit [Streptomyces sp. DSM 44917]MDT0309528.1 NrfD/PsrC family molybdoenzyme membrane anchor subunit [Streptomyces sp. DSM 44917]